MNLLVFAHTPPPLHGQSAMVAALLEGLGADPAWPVLHVNVRLSRDGADIGRWRLGKLFALLRACGQAWRLRLRHGPSALYYVPAPGQRGPLYRDLVVMTLCRPWFSRLILHWHAVGLGTWLREEARPWERGLAHWLLGRADLALVLAPSLQADAAALRPKRIAIVPNCVPDPGAPVPASPRSPDERSEVLFLGQCSRAKGLFATLAALQVAEAGAPGRMRLTIAGNFPGAAEESEFRDWLAGQPPALVQYVGPVGAGQKNALLAAADALCLPTRYRSEGQPLVLLEALAHDLPIVTTDWRGIPDSLPKSSVWLVDPEDPAQIARALEEAVRAHRPTGVLREHYLRYFTPQAHERAIKAALGPTLGGPAAPG